MQMYKKNVKQPIYMKKSCFIQLNTQKVGLHDSKPYMIAAQNQIIKQ